MLEAPQPELDARVHLLAVQLLAHHLRLAPLLGRVEDDRGDLDALALVGLVEHAKGALNLERNVAQDLPRLENPHVAHLVHALLVVRAPVETLLLGHRLVDRVVGEHLRVQDSLAHGSRHGVTLRDVRVEGHLYDVAHLLKLLGFVAPLRAPQHLVVVFVQIKVGLEQHIIGNDAAVHGPWERNVEDVLDAIVVAHPHGAELHHLVWGAKRAVALKIIVGVALRLQNLDRVARRVDGARDADVDARVARVQHVALEEALKVERHARPERVPTAPLVAAPERPIGAAGRHVLGHVGIERPAAAAVRRARIVQQVLGQRRHGVDALPLRARRLL